MANKEDKKTIGVIVRFFANDLPGKVGKNPGKTPFWGTGNVHIEANTTKSIKPQDEVFNSIDEIPSVMKRLLKKSGLVLVDEFRYIKK